MPSNVTAVKKLSVSSLALSASRWQATYFSLWLYILTNSSLWGCHDFHLHTYTFSQMFSKFSYPQTINPRCWWPCFFIGIDLGKFSITWLVHQWILWWVPSSGTHREWVPPEWESKQLIKTSQVIHTTPVHHLIFYEVKSLVSVIKKKSIIKMFLTSYP